MKLVKGYGVEDYISRVPNRTMTMTRFLRSMRSPQMVGMIQTASNASVNRFPIMMGYWRSPWVEHLDGTNTHGRGNWHWNDTASTENSAHVPMIESMA